MSISSVQCATQEVTVSFPGITHPYSPEKGSPRQTKSNHCTNVRFGQPMSFPKVTNRTMGQGLLTRNRHDPKAAVSPESPCHHGCCPHPNIPEQVPPWNLSEACRQVHIPNNFLCTVWLVRISTQQMFAPLYCSVQALKNLPSSIPSDYVTFCLAPKALEPPFPFWSKHFNLEGMLQFGGKCHKTIILYSNSQHSGFFHLRLMSTDITSWIQSLPHGRSHYLMSKAIVS